jgi:hypothetical protein
VRELEARWNAALERVSQLEQRLAKAEADDSARPKIDREALLRLAHDLPTAWNAPTTDARTRQRLTRIVIEEVVIDLDDRTNEAVVTIHWVGGRHTEVRVARVKCGRYPADRKPSAVEVMRKLGGQWPDRELAVTMNRMRCKTPDGATWTTVRVRDLRERLGIALRPCCANRRDHQRRRGSAAADDLCRLGPPADPARRAAGHAADAVRAVEGAGGSTRYRGRQDRRAGDHRPSTQELP